MNALKRRELKAQENKQLLDVASKAAGGALKLLTQPAVALVGGFVLTNLAENIVIGKTQTERVIVEQQWWQHLFPMWSLFIPDTKETTIPAGQPLTLLTKDQANVARAALVALASGGLLTSIKDVIGK